MQRQLMAVRERVYFFGMWGLLACLIGGGIAVKLIGGEVENSLEWLGGALAIAIIGLWMVCRRPLRCPKCKHWLRPSPNSRAEFKELYVCNHCHIEWDTGVPISDT